MSEDINYLQVGLQLIASFGFGYLTVRLADKIRPYISRVLGRKNTTEISKK